MARWTVAERAGARPWLSFSGPEGKSLSRQKWNEKSKKHLTNPHGYCIIYKLSIENAAIAQPVERILGKDEVASSNLASSSMKNLRASTALGFLLFLGDG